MITLRFITSNDPVSAIIRTVTWSEYSHVEFKFQDEYYGAKFDGVKFRELNYYQNATKQLLATIECDNDVEKKIVDFALAQDNKPYDYSAIFGLLFHRDWHETDSWFCSELVAAAFEYAGYPLVDKTLNRVTPQDILQSPLVRT